MEAVDAILGRDVVNFGRSMRESFEAQVAMFPHMLNDRIVELIDQYRDQALGWKLSGAGGGGYLIFVSEKPIHDTGRVLARRETE